MASDLEPEAEVCFFRGWPPLAPWLGEECVLEGGGRGLCPGCHLYLMPRFSEAGDNRNRRMGLPPHQGSQGKAPSHPLQVHTPPPAKVLVEASLGGKHTSASDSRSEAMDWARGGCGDHFELFSTSLGGQTAELVTSAGGPARFSIALLSS